MLYMRHISADRLIDSLRGPVRFQTLPFSSRGRRRTPQKTVSLRRGFPKWGSVCALPRSRMEYAFLEHHFPTGDRTQRHDRLRYRAVC
ncbi:NACHT, LRR and PYD domains-containing protein 1-like protein [Anopheles sinensis]|uniref:NACHT, LRR and PYD domains-containing protein 1-like protein n=1 Tax=Anopheles sinensis TaxID=74873 RepID=A0A084VYC7_ANOSI|nr:NACHT, LRR and PYD domains-containing protein 1-like protein [Anopheles sinensis]